MRNVKLICIFLALVSCNKKHEAANEKTHNDSVIVYNEADLYKIKTGKIKVIDTSCLLAEKRAGKEISEAKWTYTLVYGMGLHDYSNREMKSLLSGHSIALDSFLSPCARPPKGFRWHCYADLMNRAIEKRFGEKFIDSLRHIADIRFINNNPHFIMPFYECDMTSRYAAAKSYDDFLKKPEDDFLNNLNDTGLSKKQLKKQKANTEVTFIIFRDGSIGHIKSENNGSIATNSDFAKYFEREALNFVKRAKWKPALYRGIKVNSKMRLNLYNK